MNDKPVPVEITPGDSHTMQIRWSDGETSVYSFTELRKACPCATCRQLREEHDKPILDSRYQLRLQPENAPPADPILAQVDWIGNYAVRLVWTDGHSTGIYHYEFLRELSSNPD